VGAVIAAALTSACTTSSGAAPGSREAGSPADPVGSVTIAPGDPIVLGTLLATSGPTPELGTDSLRGVEMAVDYLDGRFDGHAGTLLGHPVELVDRDEACDVGTARRGAEELAGRSDIVAVIGTTCSSTALRGVARILSGAGVLMVSPSNTDPRLTDPLAHEPYYLRVAYDERIQGAAVADFADRDLEARLAATMSDGGPYAPEPPAGFEERFRAFGGVTSASVVVPDDDGDARRLLDVVGALEPDVLYAAAAGSGCRRVSDLVDGTGDLADAAFILSEGCQISSAVTSRAAPGRAYVAGPDLSRSARGEFYGSEFLPAYRDRFGTDPIGPFHAYAFDSATLLFDAIEVSAERDDDGRVRIGRSALREAAFSTDGYLGLSGTLTCTPLGDCTTDVAMAVFQLPDVPLEGGDMDADPVFRETLSLGDIEP
jgi:branched-chain amino acid transport system substrate-binding protein